MCDSAPQICTFVSTNEAGLDSQAQKNKLLMPAWEAAATVLHNQNKHLIYSSLFGYQVPNFGMHPAIKRWRYSHSPSAAVCRHADDSIFQI